mgnify:CR=1 FL=1
MAGKKKTSSVPVPSAGVPSSGQRPLLRPEAAGYDELAARISAHVKPSDPVEELYTRDMIDLTWDLQRYRRTKERVIESTVCRALVEKLAPFVNGHFRFGDIPDSRLTAPVSPRLPWS